MDKIIGKLMSAWKEHQIKKEAKSFRENQEKEEAFETVDRGLRMVPLEQIVGSVGRYHDFDQSFKPKQHVYQERMKNIRQAYKDGKTFPPVHLYKIKEEYYVVDGNHRVSAAKELGFHQIEARILEFLSSKKTLDNILYYEKTDFEEKTGLAAHINLTELGHYSILLEQINEHRERLGRGTRLDVSLEAAAADWRKSIYQPLTTLIDKGRLIRFFPGRTLADLYTYFSFHQWNQPDRHRLSGFGLSRILQNSMEEFRQMMSQLKESDYPEMIREITAFVLMNVSVKRTERIVDKLFDLEEVEEVHSVHGNIDIIIKVTLKRSLLTSDSEAIGEFVRFKVGKIPGVHSTQTLIPSFSRMKGKNRT